MKKAHVTLAYAAFAAAALAGCGAEAAGGSKAEFAEICQKRMKASAEACGCYVDKVEAALTPEAFSRVTEGASLNDEFRSAELLPGNVISDPAVRSALTDASASCLRA